MTLGTLLNMYTNGALKLTHDEGAPIGNIGGTQITQEQAGIICTNLGWTQWYLNPFEIIKKTSKFIGALKRSKLSTEWDEMIWNNTVVTFQNFRGNTYGKTYDRITLSCQYMFNYTIIYGMEKQGAAYVVYKEGNSTPVAKCRNLGKVAEYILSEMD